MARPANDQPTDGELEILQLLWELGPSTLSRIYSGLNERRPVAMTTVSTMLKLMVDKGLVDRDRVGRGSLWSARRNKRDTEGTMLERFVDRLFKGSRKRLIAHLIEDGKLSDQDRREIRELLDFHEGSEGVPPGKKTAPRSGKKKAKAKTKKENRPEGERS